MLFWEIFIPFSFLLVSPVDMDNFQIVCNGWINKNWINIISCIMDHWRHHRLLNASHGLFIQHQSTCLIDRLQLEFFPTFKANNFVPSSFYSFLCVDTLHFSMWNSYLFASRKEFKSANFQNIRSHQYRFRLQLSVHCVHVQLIDPEQFHRIIVHFKSHQLKCHVFYLHGAYWSRSFDFYYELPWKIYTL